MNANASIQDISGPGTVRVYRLDTCQYEDTHVSDRASYVLRLRELNDRAMGQGRPRSYLDAIVDGHRWEL